MKGFIHVYYTHVNIHDSYKTVNTKGEKVVFFHLKLCSNHVHVVYLVDNDELNF